MSKKKENPRKTKNRHQETQVQWSAKERVERVSHSTERNAPGTSKNEEKPFRGMDIDKMNYTDI